MPLTLQFAVKRIRKTKNCQKGYGCGNSCINKGRKCKKKFGDQASTYAGWLKKNGGGSKSKDSNNEKFPDSHSDRRARLDKLSNDKAVELIVKHTVDGQMDLELRTSVAELIDKSKKEVIKDVGEQVTSTVEKAGMSSTMKRKGDGKNIINPEYMNLIDDLAQEVLANQNKFVKGKRSPSGRLIPDTDESTNNDKWLPRLDAAGELKQEEKRSSKSLQDEIKDFKIDSSDPDTLTLPARLRRGASKVQTGKFFVRLDKLRENKP